MKRCGASNGIKTLPLKRPYLQWDKMLPREAILPLRRCKLKIKCFCSSPGPSDQTALADLESYFFCRYMKPPSHREVLILSNFNPFPNKPSFLRVCSTSLLKTLWKKEKLFNIQNFSFSQCFLPIWSTFCHFHRMSNCRLQTLSIWKSLNFILWEKVKNATQK